MESTLTTTGRCFGRTVRNKVELEAFYKRPKAIVNISVRKCRQGKYIRYRYHHKGHFSRLIGNYTIKEMENMLKINFSYAGSMSEDDIKRVEKRWRHKL